MKKVWVTGTRGIPGIIGGVETHCTELLPRLAGKGFDITVGCRRHCMAYHGNSYRGVKLRIFSTLGLQGAEALFHTLQCVIAARIDHADIIHIHAIGPALLTPLARLLGMKVIVTHHGFDYERPKWGYFARAILRLGERAALRYAHHVIAVSPHIAHRLQPQRVSAKITVIPNGVTIPPGHISPAEPPYMLALGRLVEEKGFDTLIEAYRLSSRSMRLIIAGEAVPSTAYSRELKRKATEAGVEMPGAVTGDQLTQLLGRASLFVIPSTHEGLPIALLEAMSHSLPVIASDIPANHLPEIECFFPVGDSHALSCLLDSCPRERRHYDLTSYDWDTIADQTSVVYRER